MSEADAIFHPFRGIHYRIENSGDLSDLICPPYDIISETLQGELYARSPSNFVRVELARADGGDRYAAAAGALRGWLAEGVLVREGRPAFYLLEQEFSVGERSWRRRGAFGLVRLPAEGESYVLSHEGTLAEAKADRLKLMQAARAMTSPVMLMSEDADGGFAELLESVTREPEAVARESGGVVDRLWIVQEPKLLQALRGAIGRGPLYIADGHHRFETACTYRNEMRRAFPKAPATAGFNYALALVNSTSDDGLRIFPTHRLISGVDESARRNLQQCMKQHFKVDVLGKPDPATSGDTGFLADGSDRPVFGAYSREGVLSRLTVRQESLPGGGVVDNLDVSVLHRLLIDPTLAGSGCAPNGVGVVSHDSQASGRISAGARLAYTTEASEAMAAVDRGEYDYAFFLRPTRVSEVIAAARAGERMPGKSTYFYPKIPAGLLVSDASQEPIED